MSSPLHTTATPEGLCEFIDASPSPFHVVTSVAQALRDNGFDEQLETKAYSAEPGRHFVIRGGSIVAWDCGGPVDAFRIVGGHTDSPNLRLKQHPELSSAGVAMVGLEPYGGAWLNSWLDRDLGVCGRVSTVDGGQVRTRTVMIAEPVLRVPQLAIHLSEDRKSVSLDPQRHVNAIWALGQPKTGFIEWLCAHEDFDPATVLGWDLMAFDLAPSGVIGANRDLISAPRLDNQGTCYSGLRALLDGENTSATRVLALFDHEEVGSGSERGAGSEFLVSTLERIVLSHGGDRGRFLAVMASSVCASGDMAHATHPNYPDRHEPAHRIELGGGPVLKVNQNLRYSSDAEGEAIFALACRQAGVGLQRYVHRADLPCGSTIGPITATRTGVKTVDVGAAQLAMHSAREVMGAADVGMYSAALQAFLSPDVV